MGCDSTHCLVVLGVVVLLGFLALGVVLLDFLALGVVLLGVVVVGVVVLLLCVWEFCNVSFVQNSRFGLQL